MHLQIDNYNMFRQSLDIIRELVLNSARWSDLRNLEKAGVFKRFFAIQCFWQI